MLQVAMNRFCLSIINYEGVLKKFSVWLNSTNLIKWPNIRIYFEIPFWSKRNLFSTPSYSVAPTKQRKLVITFHAFFRWVLYRLHVSIIDNGMLPRQSSLFTVRQKESIRIQTEKDSLDFHKRKNVLEKGSVWNEWVLKCF